MSNPLKFRQAIRLPAAPVDPLDAASKGYVDGLIASHTHADYALANHNHNSDYALRSISLTAGDGLTGGGTLAAARTVSLGTPGSITGASTNSVTAESHTHEVNLTYSDVGAVGIGGSFSDAFAVAAEYFPASSPIDVDTVGAGRRILASSSAMTNGPSQAGIGFWYIECKSIYLPDSVRLVQTAYSYSGTFTVMVRRFNDAWTDWTKIQLGDGGIPDVIAKDLFVAKGNAVIAVGASEAVGWGGGLANYSGNADAPDVGLFANGTGTVRIRPGGRGSTAGQVLFTPTGITATTSITTTNQLISRGTSAIGLVVDRTSGAANSIIEAVTTSGSVFFGQGRGGRFAVGLSSDLSANWQFEVDGNGVRTKPILDAQGGVMSSGHYNAIGQADTYYAITPTSGRAVRFAANSNNNTGIYDTTNSRWLIQVNSANLTTLAGALTVNGNSQLIGNTSVTGTLSTTSHAYINGGRVYGATELNLCGGSATSLIRIRPQGWTATGQTVFNANGTVTFSGALTSPDYILSSDIRLKSDIVPLGKRGRIEPIVYTMNGRRELGVSAQQIQEHWSEAVTEREDGYLGVMYDRLIPVLAVQANETEDEVSALKEELAAMRERLMTLEAIVLKSH